MARVLGTYTPPNGTWTNGAVNGVLATLADWQALLADLSNAITQSVSKDGQTIMTGDLNFGGFKLTNLGLGNGAGQVATWEQLFSQGTEIDIPSAATTNIGELNSNFLRVTGTTTITSFGTNYRGPRFLRFSGAVTLTNSSTLILPGGVNYTTAAGDVLVAIPKATSGTADGWYIVSVPPNLALYVTLTGAQTLTNKTLTSPTITSATVTNPTISSPIINDGYTEEVFTLTGTVLSPANGSIQSITLSANTTFTETFSSGQSMTLMIDDGTERTITWPSIQWKTDNGAAPTLNTTGFTAVVLWKVGTTLFGARVGNA